MTTQTDRTTQRHPWLPALTLERFIRRYLGVARFEAMEHTGGGCYTLFLAGHAIGPLVERGGQIGGFRDDLYLGPSEDY